MRPSVFPDAMQKSGSARGLERAARGGCSKSMAGAASSRRLDSQSWSTATLARFGFEMVDSLSGPEAVA